MNPPRTVVSGGTGLVGRHVVERLLAEGHRVVVTGRNRPAAGFFSEQVEFVEDFLEPEADTSAIFAGADYFVHCALDHLPGRFRGGEGSDPQGYRQRNLAGSTARFRAAMAAGVRRAATLSTRAVYGDQPPGMTLDETIEPHPNTLYGEVKLACERELAALASETFRTISLRVTGVYGDPPPGRPHKWADLIGGHLAGTLQPSRCGTEVQAMDVAWAVQIALTAELDLVDELFCVSDILVDHADILAIANKAAGKDLPLPPRADAAAVNQMNPARLKKLGWRPGGWPLLEDEVRKLTLSLLD